VPQRSTEPCRHRCAAASSRRTDSGARRQTVCSIARDVAGACDSLKWERVDGRKRVQPEGRRRKAPPRSSAVRTSLPAPIAATTAGSTLAWSGPSCARLSKAHAQNAVGDELRVLHKVGSMADDVRHQHLAPKGSCRLLSSPRLGAVCQSHQRHALSLAEGTRPALVACNRSPLRRCRSIGLPLGRTGLVRRWC
jgi:hypothetical protein